ncbi:MAG: DUF2922 family protein [Selenomonadaceae bacterium]|nr:DUF2922 family protein [Selenomonadaceae bacterium]
MADTVKSTSSMQLEFSFVDGDTRTVSIDNPKTSINLGAAAASIGSYVKEHNILLGDKTGADSKGLKSAHLVNQTTTKLDITPA